MPDNIKKHLTARTFMLVVIVIGAMVCTMPLLKRPPPSSSAMPAGYDPIGALVEHYR